MALLLTVLLMASLLNPSAAHAAPTVKEKEPNDTTATAQRVDLGTTVQGKIEDRGWVTDFYRFSAPKPGKLTLDLRFGDHLGTEGDLTLKIFNSSGTQIERIILTPADHSGAKLRSLAMFVEAGTFYVSLDTYRSQWYGASYTLKTTVTAMASETEPNGTTATADVIALGQKTVGATLEDPHWAARDNDYFRVALSKRTTVQVDFRFACNLGTEELYRLRLLDNKGKQLLDRGLTGSECNGAGLRGQRVTVPAGNLYVHISSRFANDVTRGKQYSLTVSPASPFTDVRPGMEHYDAMVWMKESGTSTGWSDGTYRPLSSVNRDAMAAFLYRDAGSPKVTLPRTSPFRDLKRTDEHYKAIVWAYQKGITTGWATSKGREFRPVQPIARDAMAAFLYRYADSPRYTTPKGACFTDVRSNQQFAKEMCWMKSTGISKGWSDGTYRPLQSVKRDAMAAFLYRYTST
ncbi:S-layer homology domain-containing protein [Brachybacterium sp. AOP42-C2-15]|uniref:S-layer homology domain-containing protein n=1 Tax=Brachybacterium sp. AOP42-C2-15 TaxID=3457670 RepID=UPI00403361FE